MAAHRNSWISLQLITLCAALSCVHPLQHGALRLDKGNGPSNGLLEMSYYGEMASVVVCLPGFTSIEAGVVCRQMGFSTGHVAFNSHKAPNRRNLGVCLSCRGTENSVTQCLMETHRFNVKTEVNHVWIDCDHVVPLDGYGYFFLLALVAVFTSLTSPRARSGATGLVKGAVRSVIGTLGVVVREFARSLTPVTPRQTEDAERQQEARDCQEDPRLGELQREMALLRQSVDVANSRLDDLHNATISVLNSKLQRLTTMVAFQTVEKEFRASNWSILLKGVPGAARESTECTQQLCVTFAMDRLGLSEVSSAQGIMWCHRTRETVNADIVISFMDIHQSNRWLAQANRLENSEDHIIINPHLPCSLLPLLSELQTQRDTVGRSLHQTSLPVFQYLARWPYLELSVNGNTVKRPTISKDTLVQELLDGY